MQLGEEFLVPLPLPGQVSATPHRGFLISAPELANDEGIAILASSHRGADHPWAFWLSGPGEHRLISPNHAAFDWRRPIGVEQSYAVDTTSLAAPIGVLSPGAITGTGATLGFGAHSAIRVQFALAGYEADLQRVGRADDFAGFTQLPQFSLWETTEGECACVVSNSKHNHFAQHVQILPIALSDTALRWSAELPEHSQGQGRGHAVFPELQTRAKAGASEALVRRIGMLGVNDVAVVTAFLGRVFALPSGA